MESVIFRYSDFFEDDGGMIKIKSDFIKLGDELISEAKRIKKEVSQNLVMDNSESLSAYEKQVDEMITINKQYIKSLNDLKKVEQEHQDDLKKTIQNEILAEKAKQESINTTKKQIQAEGELNKAIITENNAKRSAVLLEQAQQRERERTAKSVKQQRGEYAELSADLRALFTESANVASQMYKLEVAGLKASPQYQRLDRVFQSLKDRTQKLDAGLKQIDSSLGRNQRNVGDYASGFNGLSNAVNQISRELPAFTFSAQTGFLAISNNIPTLVDEITRLKDANKLLVKEGKPVESILGKIGSAVFSFNTLISIGVTLLSVYGKEFANWVTHLFSGSEALDELNKRQKEFMLTKIEGRKDAQNDIIELRKYLSVVKDQKVSDEERNIALKALRDQYPFYFKNLTDAQILAGKSTEAERTLTTALEKRKEAEKKTDLNVINKQKLIDLENQLDALKKLEVQQTKVLNAERSKPVINDRATAQANRTKELKAEDALNSTLSKRIQIQKEIDAISKQSIKNDSSIFKLKKEIIALEYKEEKQRQDKAKSLSEQQINNVDYLASDYEFHRELLNNAIKTNEEIFNSDKYSLDLRLEAQKQLLTQSLALAELERRESLRLLTKKYNDEKNATIKDGDGKILGKKYTNNGLLELEKQFGFDKQTIQEVFRQKEVDANKKAEQVMLLDTLQMQIDNIKYLQKHLSSRSELYKNYSVEISKIQNEINQIISQPKSLEINDKLQTNQAELQRLIEFNKKVQKEFDGKDYSNLSKQQRKKALKEIEAFEKRQTDLQKNADIERKLNRVRSIEEEQTQFAKDTDEWKSLETERTNILIGLESDAIKTRLDQQKESLESWKKFAIDLNDILGKILDRMIEITQKRIESEEKNLDRQKGIVDEQKRRAEQGLTNTLAFEQRAMAEREGILVKQQKKEQRLQKIKAIYTSYTSYSEKDPNTAITKALRDFAILEAISASFGEGGIPEDKLPSNGIFRGQSHQGNQGGIPILVEGREGILSAREMDNLGKGNFYKMKNLASSGKVDSNFFSGQRKQFIQTMRQPNTDPGLKHEMREVKKAIENKPVQSWDVHKITEGVMDLVETVITKNKVERNHYQTKKRRI